MFVGPTLNPPSSATSRTLIPSRVSSATVPGSSVSSAGLPSSVEAGRINPRAPRLVFSVTSANWLTNPNSLGFPSFPLRIGRASGSRQRHDPVLDRLARDALVDLPGDLLAAIRHLLQLGGRLQLRLRAAPARLAPGERASRRASWIERSNSSPVSPVSFSTSLLASPERRRIVRVIVLSL